VKYKLQTAIKFTIQVYLSLMKHLRHIKKIKEKINTFADTDSDVVAPNQFFVQPDGQGSFAIVDTYQEVIGNTFNTQEEAVGVSGVLNLISGANYSNELKSNFATMQGLNADSETNPFVNQVR
jgi:hypothetical protein